MELQHPGVHVNEVTIRSPRIESAPTAVTGFVGSFPTGPIGQPTPIRSMAEFKQAFGVLGMATEASSAVQDFFANGGMSAVIVATAVATPSTVDELMHGLSLLQPEPGHAPEVQLVCMPEMARRGTAAFSQTQYEQLLLRATGFCVQNRIFLLVDPNIVGDDVDDVERWIQDNPSWGSPNSALYVPRLHTPASRVAGDEPVAASGAVAGVMARTDAQRGVWKAPAGREASVGAVVATDFSDHQQSPLNQHGVNVIRRIDRLGAVVWGARTGGGTVGSEYRYVPVRRTALFIEHSLHSGLQWVVFEPNTEPLWARVASAVEEFLSALFRNGAFTGATADQAFYVRCDNTTMARVDLRRGRTVVEVGFAPLKPAEFVVLRIVVERR